MTRKDVVRPPAGWDAATSTGSDDNNGTPKAPTPVDEPRTPNPGNTMCEQYSGK
jgi:cell division protease FtsH